MAGGRGQGLGLLSGFSASTSAAPIEQLKTKLPCEPSEAVEHCWIQEGIAFS